MSVHSDTSIAAPAEAAASLPTATSLALSPTPGASAGPRYEAVKNYAGAPEPPEIPPGLTEQEAADFVAMHSGAYLVEEQTSGLYLAASLNPFVATKVPTAAAKLCLERFL